MSLANIADAAVGRLLGVLMRYVLFPGLAGLFALVALYHLTGAGMLALEIEFGILYAHLIVAAVYLALTLASAGMAWWFARSGANPRPSPEPTPRHIQLAALIEAAIVGYETTRKKRKPR